MRAIFVLSLEVGMLLTNCFVADKTGKSKPNTTMPA